MSKNGTVPRRYTDEFRIEAVRLGEWPEASHSIGGNQAAKRLVWPEASHKKAAAYFAKESR